jgi:hypothetical protein
MKNAEIEINAWNKLLKTMSEKFLGYFKFLFSGDFKDPKLEEMVWTMVEEWSTSIKQSLSNSKIPYSEQEMTSLSIILKSIFTSFLSISTQIDITHIQKCLSSYFTLFSFSSHLNTTSTIKSIINIYTNHYTKIHSKFSAKNFQRNIVYFLLQPELSNFPFEYINIDLIEDRINPEAEQLFILISDIDFVCRSLDKVGYFPLLKSMDNWYYMLNPQGDWKATEDKFRPIWEENKTWRGQFGTKPEEGEFYERLKKCEIYLYCGHGHGGGDVYLLYLPSSTYAHTPYLSTLPLFK